MINPGLVLQLRHACAATSGFPPGRRAGIPFPQRLESVRAQVCALHSFWQRIAQPAGSQTEASIAQDHVGFSQNAPQLSIPPGLHQKVNVRRHHIMRSPRAIMRSSSSTAWAMVKGSNGTPRIAMAGGPGRRRSISDRWFWSNANGGSNVPASRPPDQSSTPA